MKNRSGFTIVELLIVVVVIAILASVTIVAYNGIAQRASAANAQSTIESIAKRIEIDKIEGNGAYPASLSLANKAQGFTYNDDLRIEYTATSSTYCVTVGSVRAKVNFFKNNYGPITSGVCSGHLGYLNTGQPVVPVSSIFGTNPAPGNQAVYNDGGGGLWIGTRFYASHNGGAEITGVRVWEPASANATFLGQDIDIRIFLQDWTGTLLPGWHNLPGPVKTMTYTGPRVAGTWTEIIFDTPIEIPQVQSSAGTNDTFVMGIKYRGNGFDGVYYTAESINITADSINSTSPAGVSLAEVYSFGRGLVSILPSGNAILYYGHDILYRLK